MASSPEPRDASLSSRRRAARPASQLTRVMTALLVLAIMFTLHLAAGFFLPVILAIVLALIFRPIVTALRRIHVPSLVSAGLIILSLLGMGIYGVQSLAEPARAWIADAPTTFARVEQKLRTLRKPIEEAERAAEQVQNLADGGDRRAPAVSVASNDFGTRMLSGTIDAVTSVVIVAFLMFFLLATGGSLLTKIADFVARTTERESSANLVAELERQISRYLALTTLINLCLGVAVGTALWAIGLPHAYLWGIAVALLNYIPYLGGAIGTALVAVAAFLAFDEPWRMLAAPGAYILLNTIEGMVVTPLALGRRFLLDTCFVFIWLLYWSWTWGVAGAVLAMPMLTGLKIICERVTSLEPLARLIAAEGSEEPRGIAGRIHRRRRAVRARVSAVATGR